MKTLKIATVLTALLIGVFPLTKIAKTTPISNVQLEEVNVIEILYNQDSYQCRPSSEIGFYVHTELVKMSRGFKTVNASIYVFDRVSGETNLLANQHIMIPTYTYRDAVFYQNGLEDISNKTILKNGDQILSSNETTPYSFSELIKYKTIYNSYIRATNKLQNHLEAI